jgi:hypothetical protein
MILGARADGEADSMQIDRDVFDDGAVADLRRCSTSSRLTVLLNSGGLPASIRRTSAPVYINAWFDWNRDGDWDDGPDGCAPEWAIRNFSVPVASIGATMRKLVAIGFKSGRQVDELWYRVTVTLHEPAIDPGGRGRSAPYGDGETEDYLQSRPTIGPPPDDPEDDDEDPRRGGPFSVSCAPPVRVIPHGASATFRFAIVDRGRGDIFGSFESPRRGATYRTTLIAARDQRGVSTGGVRAVGFRFLHGDVDPPVRLEVRTFRIAFRRAGLVRRIVCRVVVLHAGRGQGRGRPPRVPVQHCSLQCGGVTLTEVPGRPRFGRAELERLDALLQRLRLKGDGDSFFGGFFFPLGPPNPVPLDDPVLRGSSMPGTTCDVVAPNGGTPEFRCLTPQRGPFAVDSFFDIFTEISLAPGQTLRGGVLDQGGRPIGSFEAPPVGAGQSALLAPPPATTSGGSPPPQPQPQPQPPPVDGSGTFTAGGNPNQLNYSVEFNTALEQYALVFPDPFQVQSGTGPPGFTCVPVAFEMRPNAALACNGPVPAGAPLAGTVVVNPPPPNGIGTQSRLYGAAGGTLHGPFALTGP